MEGLAAAKIFGVRCSPVRLRPKYPHPQLPLLGFPALCPSDEVHDPGDVVLLLREKSPSHRQEQLARILWYQYLGVDTGIQVLYVWLYPKPDPDDEED